MTPTTCSASSSDRAPRGRQEPRLALEPRGAYNDGADACMLVSAYGYDLDPWQARVLTAWLERTADDGFAAVSCGLAVPRQNGKNAVLEARELYGMVTTGERFLHTAHEVKTARKAFLRLCSFFENERQYPELVALVKCIRKTNGQEAIELWATDADGNVLVGEQGGSIEFSARSRGAARGFTVDTVVFDEAQELTDEQLEALLPTLAAAPSGHRQFIYTGTPPGPQSPGEVFLRTRSNAIAKSDPTLAWHEWSVEDMPRADAPLEELLRMAYDTNPALGYRLTPGFVEKEALTMSPDGFARERLGWFSPQARADRPITEALWGETRIDAIADRYTGKVVFGVKFSADGATVCVAGCKLGGKSHPDDAAVELVRADTTAGGTKELAQWLAERRKRASAVVIDGFNGSDALCGHLADLGVPKGYVVRPRTGDVITAATMTVDGLRGHRLAHTSAPALDRAATGCAKRQIGNRGGWSFGSTADVAAEPIEACALAYWGARTTKRDPKRKQRML